jgi:hypothetical protein
VTLGAVLAGAPAAAQDATKPRSAGDKPAAAPTVQNGELRKELLRRRDEDQAARNAFIAALQEHKKTGKPMSPNAPEFQRVQKADRENTTWLKEVVAKHGWPGKTLVGRDGAFIAWLLVQHADHDPKFQRHCLDLMKAMPPGEIEPRNVAYLTDRVLLAEGKKQVYGTQFHEQDGKQVPRPLEDPDRVDERRKEVGLGPIAEYAKTINREYGPKGDDKAKSKDGDKKP